MSLDGAVNNPILTKSSNFIFFNIPSITSKYSYIFPSAMEIHTLASNEQIIIESKYEGSVVDTN